MAAGKISLYATSNEHNAIQKAAALITARVQFSVAPPSSDSTDREWTFAAVIGGESYESEDKNL